MRPADVGRGALGDRRRVARYELARPRTSRRTMRTPARALSGFQHSVRRQRTNPLVTRYRLSVRYDRRAEVEEPWQMTGFQTQRC